MEVKPGHSYTTVDALAILDTFEITKVEHPKPEPKPEPEPYHPPTTYHEPVHHKPVHKPHHGGYADPFEALNSIDYDTFSSNMYTA